jgi:hypothetical protein
MRKDLTKFPQLPRGRKALDQDFLGNFLKLIEEEQGEIMFIQEN